MNIQKSRIDCIVFDFDGTLAELKLDFDHMKHRLHLMARDMLALEEVEIPSTPALEWIEELCGRFEAHNGNRHEQFRITAMDMIMNMELEAAQQGNLFPFTRPMLQELALAEIKVAIITRNCKKAVLCVFPDMETYCTTLLTRDDVPLVKPHPDHLLRALSLLGATPQGSLMVGDHPLDVETGRRAGVMTAGVSTGRATELDLRDSGAHLTAGNCRELLQVLKKAELLRIWEVPKG